MSAWRLAAAAVTLVLVSAPALAAGPTFEGEVVENRTGGLSIRRDSGRYADAAVVSNATPTLGRGIAYESSSHAGY